MSVAPATACDTDGEISSRFVIAGGPGSGKSTLLHALAASGEICHEEDARVLIREQMSQGGGALPWDDLGAFAEGCGERMRAQLQQCTHAERCFFDRGLPDLIGYLNHGGGEAPQPWRAASRGYARTVFFAPPWRDIYVNDPERPQTFAVAQALSAHIRLAYRDCGFRLIDLSMASVADRVRQVLHFLDTNYRKVSTYG
ncbi:MAG TPA: AAA family ATPase [Steroidobacteraceae bacterium]